MASAKIRALISIGRFLVGAVLGYIVYYMWATIRINDPGHYAIGAGLVVFILTSLLLTKLKGGGD